MALSGLRVPDAIAENKFDLFDLVQESIVVRSLDGRITSWNTASHRLYGWERDQAIGRPALELLRCDAPDMAGAQATLLETGRWEGSIRRVNRAGQKLTVRAAWHLRRDERGEPIDVVETGVDMTAQQQAEEALRRAEHRYTNVFRAMDVSFWELDFSPVNILVQQLMSSGVQDLAAYCMANPDFVREMIRTTRIIDVNERTVQLFGRGDKAEMLANLEVFWPESSYPVYAASVIAAYRGEPHYAANTRFKSLRGHELDTHFTACFPPEMVKRGKLVIGITDISAETEARKVLETSELRYRTLFQFVPIALVLLDRTEMVAVFNRMQAEGVRDFRHYLDEHPEFLDFALNSICIREANERAAELFGAERADQLHGPVARLWTENPEIFRRSMQARFEGASHVEAEIKIRTFDGRRRHVLYVTDFPESLNREPIGLAALIDITDQVNAKEMLTQVQAEFAHAARVSMLGELTASIAHEVNQPLGAILTNAEAALRWLNRPQPDLEELRALSVRTASDARRAADIIHRIRGMAVRKDTERSRVSLNDIIKDVMLFLGHELQRLRIEAVVELEPDLPETLADRVQLQQVMANIAINAMQAMSGSEPLRRLTIRTGSQQPGELHVEIEDTGPGIEADHLAQLFRSFFSTKQGGMGIGLSICRSIVEAHGGSIRVNNRPTGGARFLVALPTIERPLGES